jgi:transposase InsO family protein
MKKDGLLLARHTGRRIPRAHDGAIVTSRSNERWCSDVLEFTCWNGEIVRVAFALDSHDREVISWVPTTASQTLARKLRVDVGTPMLKIVRRYLDLAGQIFEASITFHPAERFSVSMRLRRSDS